MSRAAFGRGNGGGFVPAPDMATAFFCTLRDRERAEELREALPGLGMPENGVSLCYLENEPKPGSKSLARVEGYEKPPGRRLIATGHFEWGLKGSLTDQASGSVTRVLCAMGMPREEARRYETQVGNGAVLLSAFCGNEMLAKRVKIALQKARADDIASLGRAEEREPVQS